MDNLQVRLFSDRIVNGLEEIGGTGFTVHPVRVKRIDGAGLFKAAAAPKYFYLEITGEIDIDMNASGVGGAPQCPGCFRWLSKSAEPHRYVPAGHTWDGADLLRLRNLPYRMLFCTRRVLELARRDRWRGVGFEPMDVDRRHPSGINHLARTWPPERWYPPRPSEGKDLETWVKQLESPDFMERRAAGMAVVDLGELSLPPLLRLIDGPSESLRTESASLLFNISERVPLTREVRDRVRPLLPPELVPIFDRRHDDRAP